jgi:hypothetical protein
MPTTPIAGLQGGANPDPGAKGNQGKAKKKGASPLAPLESDAPSAPLD